MDHLFGEIRWATVVDLSTLTTLVDRYCYEWLFFST